jgi:hypothetical protein
MRPRASAVLARLPLLAADMAVLVACALNGTLAAARTPAEPAAAFAWLAGAFAAALLAAGLVLRATWARTAHALGHLALAAGAVQWLLGPWSEHGLLAQMAAFLLAALALAPPVRGVPGPEMGEATAVPASRGH